MLKDFEKIREDSNSGLNLVAAQSPWSQAMLYYYDLRNEWWTETVPSFPRCTEIMYASFVMGREIDTFLAMFGLSHTALLEVEKGNMRIVPDFQSRMDELNSSGLLTDTIKEAQDALKLLEELADS